MTDPTSPAALFLLNGGGFNFNSREAHAAEIGSANGITNGRGLAGMYAPLANGGELNGVKLMGPDTLARMGAFPWGPMRTRHFSSHSRFALGFHEEHGQSAAQGHAGLVCPPV